MQTGFDFVNESLYIHIISNIHHTINFLYLYPLLQTQKIPLLINEKNNNVHAKIGWIDRFLYVLCINVWIHGYMDAEKLIHGYMGGHKGKRTILYVQGYAKKIS